MIFLVERKVAVTIVSEYSGPSKVESPHCEPGFILIGPLGATAQTLLCDSSMWDHSFTFEHFL